MIERDYARVETAATEPIGAWLFRHLKSVPSTPVPPSLPVSHEVQLGVASAKAGETARITVQTPAGISGVELYLDSRLYRFLVCAPQAAVSAEFFIPATDWSGKVHRLQAVALGPQATRLASAERELQAIKPSTVIGGPPLDFDGQIIPAFESSTITGGPMLPKPDNPGHWDAHAPSRVVYPWLPGMTSLVFAYGIEEMALAQPPPQHTDGVEVVVQIEDAAGKVSVIYRYHFDRELARRARGHTVGCTPLPKGGPGRIILQMLPGPEVSAAYDWSYWLWIKASRSPIALLAGDKTVYPIRLESRAEPRQTEFNGRFITVAPAPFSIDFPTTHDLEGLSGGFGLLDTAWYQQDQTTSVDFVISIKQPDGNETRVFERTLDPANHAADRGPQQFQIRLPQPVKGTLRFSARPKTDLENAQAFWTGLSATLLRNTLRFGNGQIPAHVDSEGRYGFLSTTEEGRDCLVAHAPASLVYEWREGLAKLTGEYGLMSAAYTKNETEGVVFVVEARAADGTAREIFRRHLAPMTRPEDRGAQTLSIDIPPLPGGRLILHTLPPASGNLNAAWSYWRDLQAGP